MNKGNMAQLTIYTTQENGTTSLWTINGLIMNEPGSEHMTGTMEKEMSVDGARHCPCAPCAITSAPLFANEPQKQ